MLKFLVYLIISIYNKVTENEVSSQKNTFKKEFDFHIFRFCFFGLKNELSESVCVCFWQYLMQKITLCVVAVLIKRLR